MEQALDWLRESLSYRFILRMAGIWRQSLACRFFLMLGRIIANSRVYGALSRFFNHPFIPEYALSFRIFNRLNNALTPLKRKSAVATENSVSCRILASSMAFGILSRYLISSAVFFVFFDELGRDLFGSSSLFGYWDEAYLLICIFCLFFAWLLDIRNRTLTATPLDAPVFLLIAVAFFLYLNHSAYPAIGFEGMRAVVEFILWFYVFTRFLDIDRKAFTLIRGLIWTGGLLSVHGILQAIVGVYTPANWTDAAEGTQSARVYSILGSPNILGSILVLVIPLGLALVFQKNIKRSRKAIYLTLLACMCICLILTLSRGAWVGMTVGLVIFCIACNPGLLAGLGVLGGLTLLVPSVSNRIQYMLSSQYVISSMTGGRLLRYQIGWEMFKENIWFGVGMGHFGGAVAMNHQDIFPNTFYMDNYWLKTAVEMGLSGLAAFFILLSFLIVWSIRALNNIKDHDKRLIVIGGFSGMMGVIVHNFLENVFEVPYMVIYFWMVAAVVMYFGFKSPINGDGS